MAQITENSTTVASRLGQAFSVSVQKASQAAGFCALSLFNPPTSGKIARFRIVVADESTSGYHRLYSVTSDPNYNGANKGSVTPANLLLGSAVASVLNGTYSNTGAETDPPSFGTTTLLDTLGQSSVSEQFFLVPGAGFEIECVPGTGLLIYVNTSTNNWLASAKWYEGNV